MWCYLWSLDAIHGPRTQHSGRNCLVLDGVIRGLGFLGKTRDDFKIGAVVDDPPVAEGTSIGILVYSTITSP